jgi:uncharacterized protein
MPAKKLKLSNKPSDLKKPEDFPVQLTYVLIGICVLVAVLELGFYFFGGEEAFDIIINEFGFSTQGFLEGAWWTPITSIFLHGSPDHLIFNLIVLYFFGKATEEKLGWKKMLLIFFVAGFAGDLFSLTGSLFGLIPLDIPTIGASAAIFGLMGVSMILDPLEMVFYPFLIPIPLIFVAVLYGLFNIVAALEIVITGASSQTAYLAHIGGLTVGGIFGFHEAGLKKALIMLGIIIVLVIAVPLVLQYLQIFDYTGLFN